MRIKLKVDHQYSLSAAQCVQRYRDADANKFKLRLLVSASGLCSIREQHVDTYKLDAALRVDVPYGIDPDVALDAVIDPTTCLGKIIRDGLARALKGDDPDIQEEIDRECGSEEEGGKFASGLTFVTAEEWYEGYDDIAVDADTTDAEINTLVDKTIREAWDLGYDGLNHALIDKYDFVDFLTSYREGLD